MKFTIVDTISFPLEQVYATHRDKLPDAVSYMPNIESIVVEERSDEGDIVRLTNAWQAAETEIPSVARPFIKPELLHWRDRAVWDHTIHTVHWEIELGFLPEAIQCRGHNVFEERDGVTAVTMNGDLDVDAAKIPGVPRLLARKMKGRIEQFVIGLIEPNLRETNKVVERYLGNADR